MLPPYSMYAIQIGTYTGTGDVTLEIVCTATVAAETQLRSNASKCFGDRSVLTNNPSVSPSASDPTVAPTSSAPSAVQ